MSVTVMTDVDGHILHLDVNGARLDLDTQTAYFVSYYLAVALDKLAQDRVVAKQRELVEGAYRA